MSRDLSHGIAAGIEHTMADLLNASTGSIVERFTNGSLPGELEGLLHEDIREAAAFLGQVAATRIVGTPAIALEPISNDTTERRMRLGVINDDMPFLVDSIAAAITTQDLAIDRIIHPVIGVRRSVDGVLEAIDDGGLPESMVYIELERADARDRRGLVEDLRLILADVRAAVADWQSMQQAIARDIEDIQQGEGSALLQWFLDGKLTLLGHERWVSDKAMEALGIARNHHAVPMLAAASRQLALDWFNGGGESPLLLKSNLVSTVHRAVPLDLIVLPVMEDKLVTGLSIHAGLWTSNALIADPRAVPVLRTRLQHLDQKFGFDPRGHTGKALMHALSSLPHDLIIAFDPASLEDVALTAMSLADRPRPKLTLVRSALGRHLFAFVWLPRDDLTTGRRVAIGDMLAKAANGNILTWTIALEGTAVALIRYTIDLRGQGRMPDAAALDTQLVTMLRGWAPQVEAALAAQVGPVRAARLTLRHAGSFPIGYRTMADGAVAAADILRIAALTDRQARAVRVISNGDQVRLKLYRQGGPLSLSSAVPALENFGFLVMEEIPTEINDDAKTHIHDFLVHADQPIADPDILEEAIAAVLEGSAENDLFNRLIIDAGLAPRSVVFLRAWFRYLRQAGLTYGLSTVVDSLRRTPDMARALIARFQAAHDPSSAITVDAADADMARALDAVSAIDDDRILRAFRDLIRATLRTNAFVAAGAEALAFKFDSSLVPDLPAPVPWREIWVYSPRVEGIHLRAGPVARGGLRWSDRRDDFRTEVLGLMKAQRVKNAVIVPTGAKGGFYPKLLPSPANRDAWLAEGTASYQVFIRALLSVTDNISGAQVVHPTGITTLDGDDPYFVVAADKGTATFSDVANALALDRGFWLGDAFASGGSQGYDHKAMGITARGAWISVQRHFAERGLDVQSDPITVIGCGDMSGDVFGNGMLLSRSIKLIAAFDHRHIFLDPDPDPAMSFAERARLFALPRSSWADYAAPLSSGGGIHSRTEKSIVLTQQVKAALGIESDRLDPGALISAILCAPADLLWFGGIGTYVKAERENNAAVGDPANDRLRVNAENLRVTAIGEGANLGITQAARIAFAQAGGRINADFIDNSAGVDCSDNEVNIKIALNLEMGEGRLSFEDRNVLLSEMTEDVSALVLEDNRLQTLALSIAEADGAGAVPSYVRLIEIFEAAGRLNRQVEGLATNEDLLRRGVDGGGLTRPELAVLLATAKLALQAAIEEVGLGNASELESDLCAAFPTRMRERHGRAITHHRLRSEIVATKLANRIINRMGLLHPFEVAEEEGGSMGDVAAMFVVAERLFGLNALWHDIETADMPEAARIALFDEAALATRSHIADLLRVTSPGTAPGSVIARLSSGVKELDQQTSVLLLDEARAQGARIMAQLIALEAPESLSIRVVRLFESDGAIGLADLSERLQIDAAMLTRAFTHLGAALGLDWAQSTAARISSTDPWERLLIAGLARDFQQLRFDFLARKAGTDPQKAVDAWLDTMQGRVVQFKAVVDRARRSAIPNAAMLAQIAGQARVLLSR